jgi:SAM-dependent methyltransferase
VRLRSGDASAEASERKPRPDIAARFPRCPADACFGFAIYLPCPPFCPVWLEVTTESGVFTIPVAAAPDLVVDAADSTQAMQLRFLDTMREAHGTVLELGARSVTGLKSPWGEWLAPACRHIRSDVHPAPEIDVVVDAHDLAATLGECSMDGVFSSAVLEHLAAPWLVAAEINRVLRVGGLTYHLVPHTWPLHEQPNDFWRFSDEALCTLFGPELGFEVLDRAMTGGFRVHPALVNRTSLWLEMPLIPAHGSAAILARKVAHIAPDLVRWPTARAALQERARLYPRHDPV